MAQQSYYPNYYQTYQQPRTTTYMQQPQIQPQQSDQGGLISVPNEQQARNWPIAPGVSLTFKDENSPYIYTKTMGFSQLDQPIFEKYLVTKEESSLDQNNVVDYSSQINDIESQLSEIKDAYKLLKNELDEMKNWMRQPFMSSSNGGQKYE